jgi:hypothetical protein
MIKALTKYIAIIQARLKKNGEIIGNDTLEFENKVDVISNVKES